MSRVACSVCRQCNRKGKPSVTRLSSYCDKHYINQVRAKTSLFSKLVSVKDRLLEKRFDEKTQSLKKKGFREDYFYRGYD